MANLSFAASVAAWAEKVEGAAEAIFKEAVQDLVEEVQRPQAAGGRMRVDTGFLRASLMASTSAMPQIIQGSTPTAGQSYAADFGQIEAVIVGADIGETVYLGYTAGYAAFREYGSNGQPADAFVRTAAQRWPQIVEVRAAAVKSRLGL